MIYKLIKVKSGIRWHQQLTKRKSVTFRLKTAGFPGSSFAAFSTQNSALLSHSSLLTSNSATFSTRSLWAGFKSTDRYRHTHKSRHTMVSFFLSEAWRHAYCPKGKILLKHWIGWKERQVDWKFYLYLSINFIIHVHFKQAAFSILPSELVWIYEYLGTWTVCM